MLTHAAPERSKDSILSVLLRVLPLHGRVLEVASGTGQHVAYFAEAMPALRWWPSDHEEAHRSSIRERTAAAGLKNVAEPLALDVLERPWPIDAADAIVCINMIHITPWEAGLALLQESARLLPNGGLLYLYGPFRRDGQHTASGSEATGADLRQRFSVWGVRNLQEVERQGSECGLALREVVAMPSNNVSVIFRAAGRSRPKSL